MEKKMASTISKKNGESIEYIGVKEGLMEVSPFINSRSLCFCWKNVQ